jgi:hypothetical protein
MNNWISIKDQLPPLGKKIVVTNPHNKNLSIVKLGYSWEVDSDRDFLRILSEDDIRKMDSYWFLLPPLPEAPNE